LVAVLALYRHTKDAFSRDDLRILMAAAPKVGAALENALKFREMERQAHSDPVTDLPDSYLLMKSLKSELVHAQRSGQSLALAVMKLSGVSSLGDQLAHKLLRSVSKSIKDSFRRCDYFARTGEDTFALILPGMVREDLRRKITRLSAIVTEAERQVCDKVLINLIVGEALYPDDADEPKLMMMIAERRLDQHSATHADSLLALSSQGLPAENEQTSQIEIRATFP
jgi:diguanylate cyclase (GGDEF)-like protein